MLNLFLACVCVTFSSHRQTSTGCVAVTATCATSPLSQITYKTKGIAKVFAEFNTVLFSSKNDEIKDKQDSEAGLENTCEHPDDDIEDEQAR